MRGSIKVEAKRLEVRFDYHPATVDAIKRIALKYPTRKSWIPEKKVWRLPHEAACDIAQAFPNFTAGPEFAELLLHLHETANELAERQIAQAKAIQAALPMIDDPMPSGKKLYPFQREGVEWLCLVQNGILAWDMGLGKTLGSLLAAKIIRAALGTATVVICPANKIRDWQKESEEVGIKPYIHSWAKIPDHCPEKFVLIGDECHFAQNISSARTGKFLALAAQANAVFGLSGTPMRNGRPVNLFPLLKAIRHELSKDKGHYEKRYCAAGPRPWTKWDTSGASNLEELKAKTADCILRRLKSECLDLPAKTRVKLAAEMTPEVEAEFRTTFHRVKMEYEQRKNERIIRLQSEIAQLETQGEQRQKEISALKNKLFMIDAADELALLGQLRQAASRAKTSTAIETAEQAIAEGGKVIIFTAFRETAAIVAAHFDIDPFIGGLNPEARQRLIDDFTTRSQPVFVATLDAGGTGLNLQAANTVILMDRPLTPGDAEQAEDRAYRIGTKWPVTSIWIQAFEIDQKIDDLLESKVDNINKVIGGMLAIPDQPFSAKGMLNLIFKES